MEHGKLTHNEVDSHRDTEAQRGMARWNTGGLTRDEVDSHRGTEGATAPKLGNWCAASLREP